MAVNFLTQVCNTTVVLCSATQPAVDITKFPIILDEDSSMTGNTDNDFKVFQRTKIIPNIVPHGYSYEEAAGFCMEKFKQHGN
jgi:CRISPR-associated endonuclease/helicase Cas3